MPMTGGGMNTSLIPINVEPMRSRYLLSCVLEALLYVGLWPWLDDEW